MAERITQKEFGIKSIEKAFFLLDLILASPHGVTLSFLAEKSSCNASTVRNILRTMEKSSHIMRSKEHLYQTGAAFYPYFRRSFFSEEEKIFLVGQIKKISLLCGETICLFGREEVFCREEEKTDPFSSSFFCLASHAGSKGVIAGLEAAENSIYFPSPARSMLLDPLLQRENKEEIMEGKAVKNSLWSICMALPGKKGAVHTMVLAVFLPCSRASKEKCASIKEFLLLQKVNSPLFHFLQEKRTLGSRKEGSIAEKTDFFSGYS